MSWKSKLKSVGVFAVKYVLTAGLGAVADRYVSKRAAGIVKDILGATASQKALPHGFQQAIDEFVKAQVRPAFDAEMAEMRETIGTLLKDNDALARRNAPEE